MVFGIKVIKIPLPYLRRREYRSQVIVRGKILFSARKSVKGIDCIFRFGRKAAAVVVDRDSRRLHKFEAREGAAGRSQT